MSIKLLGKQSLIYGLGHVAVRGATFLLLPLYTNIFTPEEYGIISLAYMFLGFMNIILHYGLDASLLKHYVPANKQERKAITTNAYTSIFITNLAFIILLILLQHQISRLLFGIVYPQIITTIAGILFFDILWAIHVLIIRAEGRPVYFTVINFSNVSISLGLNLFFVLQLQMGMLGVLLSNLITSVFIFCITIPIIISRFSYSTLSIQKWKQLMHFGLPFFPAGIFAMILELSDRYILRYLSGIDIVGLYNAGYKLGMLMMLVVMGFNMAWQPFFLKKEKTERDYIAKVTTLIMALLCFILILLTIWIDDLVQIQLFGISFFGEQYWSSTKIVPVIALAYLFHAAYLLQLPGVYLMEKSSWIAWIRGLGAISNVVLNFTLIPHFGILGAATATCSSFILMAFVIFMVNRRIFVIHYEWKNIFVIFVSALGLYFLSINFDLSFMQKILMSLSFPVISIFCGVFRIRDFNFLFVD